MRSFRRFTAAVLLYNLAVILWGAVVRASGSGAGCGGHWPLCNGAVVPRVGGGTVGGTGGGTASTATLVEYSHRVSSGLVLVLAGVLAVWAFRASPPGHAVRRGALLAVAFTLSEAAIGAGLVLFRLVAHDESLARAVAIGAHLLNTFLLLAALALTWRWAEPEGGGRASPPSGALPWRPAPLPPRLAGTCWAALGALMVVGASGAVAALGDTLFPSATLAQGLAQDLSPAAHLLVRLRGLHPFLALAAGLLLLHLAQRAAAALPAVRPWANRLRGLVLAQWFAGLLDIGLLAPVPLQLAHLLLADLVWLALVLLAAELLVVPAPVPAAAAFSPVPPAPAGGPAAVPPATPRAT